VPAYRYCDGRHIGYHHRADRVMTLDPAPPSSPAKTAPSLPASLLSAYGLGALLGVLALLCEALLGPSAVRVDSFLAYAAAGGILVLVVRAALSLWIRREAGHAALVVVSGLLATEALYFANIHWLAGDHFLSARSLAVDALIVALFMVVGHAVLRVVRRLELRPTQSAGWRRFSATALLLTLPGALIAGWPSSGPTPGRSGDGPDLLLVVLDSARADHLGLYGYAKGTSPDLERLAPQARIYERAFSASTWTVPSVASMMLTDLEAPSRTPLAAELAAKGYVTACFTDNPHLTADSPLLRGFDWVRSGRPSAFMPFRATMVGVVLDRVWPSTDTRVVDAALSWAERQRSPTFVFVHLMDSHTPYRLPRLEGQRRSGRRIEFPSSKMNITADEAEDIVARYDAGVRSTQAEAFRLIDALRRRPRPLLGVVTADHGESLGEAGRWFHGTAPAPELLRVPLLAVGVGVEPGRVDSPVGHAAIPETLLAAAGGRCDHCMGADLRNATAQSTVEGGVPSMWRYRVEGRYAVLLKREGAPALFDLEQDPFAQADLAREMPRLAAELARRTSSTPEREVEAAERLRALGYVAQ
jgi:hypothetical protein